jgi:Putative prokaryotic signal transducing protein
MEDPDIVEIYSAANSIEAYAMANALKAAGIKARVVGDVLGTAAGGLAVGAPIAPRVWIRRQDEAHARGLLKQWNVDAQVPAQQQT